MLHKTEDKGRPSRWLLGIVISLAALALAVRGVPPGRLSASLGSARIELIGVAAVFVLIGLAARARSWQILLGDGIPISSAFSALNVGYLLNNALPFRLGELGRAYLIGRNTEGRISASRALSSVVVERLIDVVVSLTGLVAAIPFALSAPWAPSVAWAAALAAAGLYLALYLAARFRSRLVPMFSSALSRVFGGRLSGLSRLVDSFLSGLEVLRNPRRLGGAAFWSAIAWLTAWAQIWLVQRAFGVEGGSTALFALGVVAFGAAVPSSPGAIGVYELSVVAALLAFNIPRETALSVALVSHACVLGVTSLLGAVSLAREGQSLSEVARSAQRLVSRPAADPSG